MRRLACVVIAAAVTVGPPAAAQADDTFDVKTWDGISGDLQTNTVYDLDARTVYDIELPETESLDTTAREGNDTVVRLRTDILFAFAKADLIPQAKPQITKLVAKAPKNAKMRITGYTDAIGTPAANRTLSLTRAKAVAAVVRTSRPDLKLEIEGLGESNPVASNTKGGKDNPDGRAKNRRVELRYQS